MIAAPPLDMRRLANRDDPAAYCALADWLEEHGHPEAWRAGALRRQGAILQAALDAASVTLRDAAGGRRRRPRAFHSVVLPSGGLVRSKTTAARTEILVRPDGPSTPQSYRVFVTLFNENARRPAFVAGRLRAALGIDFQNGWARPRGEPLLEVTLDPRLGPGGVARVHEYAHASRVVVDWLLGNGVGQGAMHPACGEVRQVDVRDRLHVPRRVIDHVIARVSPNGRVTRVIAHPGGTERVVTVYQPL
jgi:uncharacterized protein (TIGR02996 family)